jgi:hypothetical protein
MSNELIPGFNEEDKTMSTMEIADLTGKQHKNVLADCRKMLEELNLRTADFSAVRKAGNNREYEVFNLDERLTINLVGGYELKLRDAVTLEWQKFRNEREALMKSIQEADPKILQYMTNVAISAQTAKAERDVAIRTKAQISSSREATIMSKLAHMSPLEAFNEDRIRCLERANSRGLITVKEIGRRVRKLLGGRLVYHEKHTIEPDSNRPEATNQALLDLGFQVEIPENQRDTSRKYKGRNIPWHVRYEIPAEGIGTDEIAIHAGVVLTSVASTETKYGFNAKQSLRWAPTMVKAVYEYMQQIKRAKEQSKAKSKAK